MRVEQEKNLRTILTAQDGVAMAKWLGFEPLAIPIEGHSCRAWGIEASRLRSADLTLVAAPKGLRILHLHGDLEEQEFRSLLLTMSRALGEMPVLWWWTSSREWRAAKVCRDERERLYIRKLILDCDEPDEVGLLQWQAFEANRVLEAQESLAMSSWTAHLEEVLDQDGVTREFFTHFREALFGLRDSMLQGPIDEEERHHIALSTLLRVLFLYFLQARGALNHDKRYVFRVFQAHKKKAPKESFYRGLLRPLFFGALNCPPSRRGELGGSLGTLPFLNGGLFEPSPLEKDYEDLDFPDQLWEQIFTALFERHRFAVEWSREGDLSRAVDPEMLGKVFEGLMYGDERRSSGSFYTPREVVAAMVEGTLGAWLEEKTSLEEQEAQDLVQGRVADLSGSKRLEVREALRHLTILDLAVGTGAFLLETLRVLWRMETSLDEISGVCRTPGERYEAMRRLVQDHLYGVDIQSTAVRLCELRIWLAMLATLPELPVEAMPPLPNLSHKLCTGNTLIDPLDWIRFRGATGSKKGVFLPPGKSDVSSLAARQAGLQESYTRAHGEEKQAIGAALDEVRIAIQEELLQKRLDHLQKKGRPLYTKEASQDLFGVPVELSSGELREKKLIEEEEQSLARALKGLREKRVEPGGFSFPAHFAPVMAQGGFEIIITNPPWVRSTALERGAKDLYRHRFQCSDHSLWEGASELGVAATFGAQADLSALFVERSLELLRPGGRLCALVPAKLFRSLLGAGLRGILGSQEIEHFEDRSEDLQPMFDATTYPAVIRVRKKGKTPRNIRSLRVHIWRRGQCDRFESTLKDLTYFGKDPKEPWIALPPSIRAIFEQIQEYSTPLGALDYPVRRGVMTGCNRAFLVTTKEGSLFSRETQREYLREVIRGKDLSRDTTTGPLQIIWPYDKNGECLKELPPDLEAHFSRFEKVLRRRSDYRKGQPYWTLFRCHEDLLGPKLIWRDMSTELQAAIPSEQALPLNTIYYIPTKTEAEARALKTLFHSEPLRAVAFALGERARGEWRRHFSWVIRLLPVPKSWVTGGSQRELKTEEIDQAFGLTLAQSQALRAWRLPEEEPCRFEEVS